VQRRIASHTQAGWGTSAVGRAASGTRSSAKRSIVWSGAHSTPIPGCVKPAGAMPFNRRSVSRCWLPGGRLFSRVLILLVAVVLVEDGAAARRSFPAISTSRSTRRWHSLLARNWNPSDFLRLFETTSVSLDRRARGARQWGTRSTGIAKRKEDCCGHDRHRLPLVIDERRVRC
jgi:hypothetical protein